MARVTLLSPAWRLVTAMFIATSLATLPTYVLALFFLPPVPAIVMGRSFVVGTALPALMAWALGRAFAGTAEVSSGMLRLRRGDLDIEVACARLGAVRPWRLPLPGHGLTLRLQSGERLPMGVAMRDPTPLLDRLAEEGVDVAAARSHPSVVHAATRRAHAWWTPLLKFVVFGAAPATVLFYTHQHIAYGGTFGQYYLEGLGPYLSTFVEYWYTTVILLVSYASFWRAGGEVVVWTVPGARRVVEVVCGLAYYAGVPIVLALRYLA